MKGFIRISISLFVLLLLLSSSLIPSSTNASGEWKVEKFEKLSAASSEKIEVDNKGNPHILYTRFHSNPKNQINPRMDLKYAYWTGTSWKKTTIDIIGIYYSIDRFSFKLDKDGNPHLAYANLSISEKPINHTSSFYNYRYQIKYATYINREWRIETIEKGRKTGYYFEGQPPLHSAPDPCLSLDSQGAPHLVYTVPASQEEENYTEWDLVAKYAKKTNNSWKIENVTGGYDFGLYMDKSDKPYVIEDIPVYYSTKIVAHEKAIFTKEDDVWTSTTLCRWNTTDVYFYPVEKSFESHLPKYILLKEPFLRCLRWDGEKYEVYVIDKKVYWSSSLSIDREGIPHVAYAGKDGLRYAVFDGDKWLVSTVVLTGANILNPHVAAYSSSLVFMSYTDSWSNFFLLEPVPPPLSNLTATVSHSEVKLTWKAPLYDGNSTITAYKIYRGTANDSLEVITTVNGSVTEYLDDNVTAGEKYYYAVSAVNSFAESNLSETVSVVAQEAQPVPSLGLVGTIGSAVMAVLIASVIWVRYRRRK